MFEKKIRVQQSDLDQLEHVNNVKYVDWVQDIALEHWNEKAPLEMQEKWVWVMTKHCIEYRKASFLGNTISVKTYLESSNGAMATRIVEFYNESDNKASVTSTTSWCLLDASTFKPKRIPEDVSAVFIE
ncbi:MAG: acyl-CoA thioesterase [Flavobacteriaceae bacterium]|nr:acyl-CoA thioesterase [Flavobacteriaceae bacterium]